MDKPRDYSAGDRSIGTVARLNRAAMLLLVLAYPLLIVALAGGLFWLAWQVGWWAVRLPALLVLAYAGVVVVACVLYGLYLLFTLLLVFFRHPPEPKPDTVLWPTRHPRLFKLIGRVAQRLRVAAPDAVNLDPGAGGSIACLDLVDGAGNIQRRAHVLTLGAQYVVLLNAAELTTIVCHELAHAATGDTFAARVSRRFFVSLGAALNIRTGDGPDEVGSLTAWSLDRLAWLVQLSIIAFCYLFAMLYRYDCRVCEYRADRLAAEMCGPQHTRNALLKSTRLHYLTQRSIHDLAWECTRAKTAGPVNVYEVFRRRLANATAQQIAQAENEAFMAPATVWDSHPNLAARFRRLAEVKADELRLQGPASSLFDDWPRLELELSARLLEVVDLHRQMGDVIADHVVQQAMRGR